eukprot:470256_1
MKITIIYKLLIVQSNNDILFHLTLNSETAKIHFSNLHFIDNKLVFHGDNSINQIFINSSIIFGIDAQIIHNNPSTELLLNDVHFTSDDLNMTFHPFVGDGGYIYSKGPLNIIDCSFNHSNIEGNGGFIVCKNCKRFQVTNTIFYDATASKSGGMIYIAGDVLDVIFKYCSFIGGYSGSNGGMIWIDSVYAKFDNCEFIDSYSGTNGGAIYDQSDKQESLLEVTNSQFVDAEASLYGGGIYVDPTRIYLENTSFHKCVCKKGGGGIYNKHGDDIGVTHTAINVNFTFCESTGTYLDNAKGGAMRSYDSCWNMENVYFINNTAMNHAGAIIANLADGYNCYFNHAYFINNTAVNEAGAVYFNAGSHYFNNSVFMYNSANDGGAIVLVEEAQLYLANTLLSFNEATEGAALYSEFTSYFFYRVQCEFNWAWKNGACIFDDNPSSSKSTIDHSILNNNSAISSGAGIYLNGGGAIYVSNTEISNNTVFGGIGGGGVFVSVFGSYFGENNIYSFNYALQGAGMRILSDSRIWLNNETFNDNYGKNAGGAICGVKDYNLAYDIYIYQTVFTHNYAPNGGAIYLEDVSYFDDINWNLFIFNSSFNENNNSAIFAIDSNVILRDNIFSGNTNNENGNGGAIFINEGMLNDKDSIFNNNAASVCGGSIAMINSHSLGLDSTHFEDNFANISGGAICIDSCPTEGISASELATNVTFISNKAGKSGAAIQLESDTQTECGFCNGFDGQCHFENNVLFDGVLSEFGALHSSWKLMSDNIVNNGKIDNSDKLEITSQLYDSYNQTITYIREPIVFEVDVDNDLFFLSGTQSDSFDNSGFSFLTFSIEKYNVLSNDRNKKWEINLSFTASDIYSKTYLLEFSLKFSTTSNVFFAISTFFFITTLIVILCIYGAMFYYRKTSIIHSTHIVFSFIILFGLIMLLTSLYVFTTISVTSSSCISSFILLHFGVICVIGPLGGKTLLLYRIFNNARLKQLKGITKKWLVIYWVICPCFVIIIYLIFWMIFDSHSVVVQYFNASHSYEETCDFDSTFIYITLSMIGAPLFGLCLLTYEARKLPKNYNETFWIGSSLYSVAIMMILSIPIMVNKNIEYLLKMQLLFIAGIICINMILIFLFVLKIYRVLINYEGTAAQTLTASYLANSQSGSQTKTTSAVPPALQMATGSSSGRSDGDIVTKTDIM